jgi:hypothetical protein
MKRAIVPVSVALFVFALAIPSFAQMGMMNKAADSSQTGQKPANMNESQMVDRMASNQEMMTSHFDSLQTMWNKMMAMNNVSDLKAGWTTYKNAMKVMQQDMSQQGMMYQEAMPSKGNNGMMMNSDQNAMLQKLDGNYQIMSSRFDSLQTMTDKMINMNNMSELKGTMKDYQQMMTNMHTAMANQGMMYKKMMAMMGDSQKQPEKMKQEKPETTKTDSTKKW